MSIKNKLKYGNESIGQSVYDSKGNKGEIINMYTAKGGKKCMVTILYDDNTYQDREKYFVSKGLFKKPIKFNLETFIQENKEIWKPVYGYEKEYYINEYSDIISISGQYKGKIINKQIHSSGNYYANSFYKNGKRKLKFIHRIMVESFIRPLKDNEEVNHIDGNGLNNILCNLEILNKKQNNQKYINLNKWINKKEKENIDKYCLKNKINYKDLLKYSLKKVYRDEIMASKID